VPERSQPRLLTCTRVTEPALSTAVGVCECTMHARSTFPRPGVGLYCYHSEACALCKHTV